MPNFTDINREEFISNLTRTRSVCGKISNEMQDRHCAEGRQLTNKKKSRAKFLFIFNIFIRKKYFKR